MKGNRIEVLVLMLLVAAVVLILIVALTPMTSCNKNQPTAGDVVSCIATRTAETRNK